LGVNNSDVFLVKYEMTIWSKGRAEDEIGDGAAK